MPSDRTLVVADDLTGATDTGHGFATRGYETVVRLSSSFDAPDADVLVVDTDSRYAPPDEAAERVRRTIDTVAAAVVYKKVDSTLRGNLGPEIEAAMAAMDADAAAVAPAFPSNGRTTACGYHLVEGALVTETEAGSDPDAPVTRPRLPDYLREQGATGVEHVGVADVARGAVGAALADGRILTFDAVHDSHLDAVGTAAGDHPGRVLLVGSGGLAEHVRVPGEPDADRPPLREHPTGTAFGVAGSVSERTLDQLDALPPSRVVDLDAARAVALPAAAAEDAAADCREALRSESTAVLASARSRDDVDAVLAAAADADVSERVARERVTAALASAARRVWGSAAPDGLFLTGGAVATAVLDALDADGIVLRGEAVATGVPVGAVRGGTADGTPVVTKAGAFGESSTIADALTHLRRVPRGKQ